MLRIYRIYKKYNMNGLTTWTIIRMIMLLKYQNDTKQLNLWLKSVSFDNFYRPYSILLMQYVHILKYHLSKIDKDIHKTKYMEVAVSFFPEFFTENYLLNYFKS